MMYYSVMTQANSEKKFRVIITYLVTLNELDRIRSNKGLTLKTSALESLYGGQINLSTLLITAIIRSHLHVLARFMRDTYQSQSKTSLPAVNLLNQLFNVL